MENEEKDRLLREMHAYARATAASALGSRAKAVIDDYQKARVYLNLDGLRTDEQIHNVTGVPRRAVTAWVELFVKNNLAIASGRSERALFTLEELGVDLPALKKEWEKKSGR